MSEIKKLIALRSKLVSRRRAIVASFQAIPAEQLTGDAFAMIQNAIDAVDRAVADENAAEESGASAVDRAIAEEKAAALAIPLRPAPRP